MISSETAWTTERSASIVGMIPADLLNRRRVQESRYSAKVATAIVTE